MYLFDGFNIWLIICLGVIEWSWFQVFDLKVNGVALRLLPEASQIKNALQVTLGSIVLYSSFSLYLESYIFSCLHPYICFDYVNGLSDPNET